jgi:hypothetical protein
VEARHIPNFIRPRLCIEIAEDDRREAVFAHQHFSETNQIGRETFDPLPDQFHPFRPWAPVMPDIQGEELQSHASNLAAETPQDRRLGWNARREIIFPKRAFTRIWQLVAR